MKDKIVQFITVFAYSFIAFTVGFLLSKNESFNQYLVQSINSLVAIDPSNVDENVTVWHDLKDKTHDHLTLITRQYVNNPAVILVNSDGKVVHKWNLDKKVTNPALSKYHDFSFTDDQIVISASDAYLYPNGNLLAIQEVNNFDNFRGERLVMLDKDSKVLWQLIGQYHHEINVTKDGRIYALDYAIHKSSPNKIVHGSNPDQALFLHDTIHEISPTGELLSKISIPEAFANSKFSTYLSSSNFELDILQITKLKDNITLFDLLHANSVQYLDEDLAANLPNAQTGDLLISMRGLSAIAILRPSENTIVWFAKGPWRHQHHVNADKEGNIIIYDNEGGSRINVTKEDKAFVDLQPRLLKYNPTTEDITVLYNAANNDNNFASFWKGSYHFLDDGSKLVMSSDTGRIRQVTDDNKIIWELRTIKSRSKSNTPYTSKIPMARFYEKEYAEFLK